MPELSPERIVQTAFSFWSAKVLLSAIEMEAFTEIARHPADLKTLEGRLGLHPRSSRDFLDCLVALGFLTRKEGVYHNTPESDLFLDKRKHSYIGGVLEMLNHRLYGFWGRLTEALRTGQPQNEVRDGMQPLFVALYADPARLRQFLGAMTGLSLGAAKALAGKFPWKNYRSVCDVGPAQGAALVEIVSANSHMSGIGFDLPEVGPIFEDYVEDRGLSAKIRFEPGSFFDRDLPKADVIVMGHVLHDWDLDTKRMLVRKAYEALPAGGAYIVHEALIDDDRSKHAFGLLMSLNMLIETSSGFDFSGADCEGWMREAGFGSVRVEHLSGPDWMVVATK